MKNKRRNREPKTETGIVTITGRRYKTMDIKLDSHKLAYHPKRLSDWMDNEDIAPIYMEISPSSACNYRCAFCAYDYLDYSGEFIDTKKLKKTLKEAAKLGVKSINYSGQGEPLLHKDIADIIKTTKVNGIDVAVTTNGVCLTKEMSEKILDKLTWIRVSLNADSAKTYKKVHGVGKDIQEKVFKNIKDAVAVKRKKKLPVTISVQYLLIKENYPEIFSFIKKVKNLGVDYISIKPFCEHLSSKSKSNSKFSKERLEKLEKEIKKYETDNFKVFFRLKGFYKYQEKTRAYGCCLGLPFFAEIATNGDVYPCNSFIGRKQYVCGNINKQSFKDILKGKKRKQIFKKLEKENFKNCRKGCRLDEINRFLWNLKNPNLHVNFI